MSLQSREGEASFPAVCSRSCKRAPRLSLAPALQDAGAPQFAAIAIGAVRRILRPSGDATARSAF